MHTVHVPWGGFPRERVPGRYALRAGADTLAGQTRPQWPSPWAGVLGAANATAKEEGPASSVLGRRRASA